MRHTFDYPWGSQEIETGERLAEAEIRTWCSQYGRWRPWKPAVLLRGHHGLHGGGSDNSLGWYTVEWGHLLVHLTSGEEKACYEVRPLSQAPSSSGPDGVAEARFRFEAIKSLKSAIAMLALGQPMDPSSQVLLDGGLEIKIVGDPSHPDCFNVSFARVEFKDGRSIEGLHRYVAKSELEAAVSDIAVHLLWMFWQVEASRKAEGFLSRLGKRGVGFVNRRLAQWRVHRDEALG